MNNRQELLQEIQNIQAQLRQWQPAAVRAILEAQLELHEADASDYGGGGVV